MKGDIILGLIKLLQNKKVGQTFRYPYLQTIGAKTAYLYWLCCLLCKAGYIKRLKNGLFEVVKSMSDLGSCKELFYTAYNRSKYGVKIQDNK